MKIIGLVLHKGGVGKTTTVSALGYGLANKGKRVLFIDADPQGNLTNSIMQVNENQLTSFEWLSISKSNSADFYDTVVKVGENVHMIPTTIALAEAEVQLTSKMGREMFLKKAISRIPPNKFDYVIIDSQPSLGLLTINVLCACDEIIIPFRPEKYSVDGCKTLANTVYDVQQMANPNLKVRGFLVTMKDNRRNTNQKYIDAVAEIAKDVESSVFSSQIRAAVAASEAPDKGQSLFDYAPKADVTADYQAFVDEYLKGEANNG